MAEYEPPREILPIFDPEDFIHTNNEPLTLETASKYFLKYPYGQGLEYIPDLIVGSTTTLNGSLQVAGLSDFNDNVNISVAGSGVANPTLTIQSNNDDDKGAYLKFYKNSTTPADGDRTGALTFWSRTLSGGGGASAPKEFGRFRNAVLDYTHNAEYAKFNWMLMKDGTLEEIMDLTATSLDLLTDVNFTQTGTGVIQQTGTGQNELKDTNVIGTLLVNGSPVSGGGTLAQTLQAGNSAGTYSIDMNSNNINNINNLTLSTPAITGEKYLYFYRALNTSNGASLGTISWNGLSSTSIAREYGNMNVVQGITTNGTETGQMLFNIREAGTLTNYMKMGRASGMPTPLIQMYRPATIFTTDNENLLTLETSLNTTSPILIETNKSHTGGGFTGEELCVYSFKGTTDTSTSVEYARLSSSIIDATNGTYAGGISYYVASAGTTPSSNPPILSMDYVNGIIANTFQMITSSTATPLSLEYNTGTADTGYLRLVKSGNNSVNNGMGIDLQAINSGFVPRTQARIRTIWTSNTSGSETANAIVSLRSAGATTDILTLAPVDTTLNTNFAIVKPSSGSGSATLTMNNQITGVNGATPNRINFFSEDSAGNAKQSFSLLQTITDATPATYSTESAFYNIRNNVLTKAIAISDVIRNELSVINENGSTSMDRNVGTLGTNNVSMTNYDTGTATNGQVAHQIDMYAVDSASNTKNTFSLRNTITDITPATYSTQTQFYNMTNNVLTNTTTINNTFTNNIKTNTTQGLEVSNGFKVNTTTTAPTTDIEFQLTTASSTDGLGINIYKNQSSYTSGEQIGSINFYSNATTGADQQVAGIRCMNNSATAISGEIEIIGYTGASQTLIAELRPTDINARVPLIISNRFRPQNVNIALAGNVSYATTFTFLGGNLVITSNTSATNTITIPNVASSTDYYLWIRNESNTAFIISSDATLQGTYGTGTTTQTLYGRQNIQLYCDGTNWKIVSFTGLAQTIVYKNTGSQSIASSTIATALSPTTQNISWSSAQLTNTSGVISNGTGEDMTLNIILTYTWANNVNSSTNATTTASNGNRSHWIQHSNTANYPKFLGTYNVNPNTTTAGTGGTANIYFRETLYASLTTTFLLKNGETFTPVAYQTNNVVSGSSAVFLYSTGQLDAFAMTITRVQ